MSHHEEVFVSEVRLQEGKYLVIFKDTNPNWGGGGGSQNPEHIILHAYHKMNPN